DRRPRAQFPFALARSTRGLNERTVPRRCDGGRRSAGLCNARGRILDRIRRSDTLFPEQDLSVRAGAMMPTVKEAFVTVCDCRTFVRRSGAGQPVLFLHGAGGLPGWQPFLERLAERYDVLAPDHPGYGQSEAPPWLEDVSDLAQFYLEFLKAFDLTG